MRGGGGGGDRRYAHGRWERGRGPIHVVRLGCLSLGDLGLGLGHLRLGLCLGLRLGLGLRMRLRLGLGDAAAHGDVMQHALRGAMHGLLMHGLLMHGLLMYGLLMHGLLNAVHPMLHAMLHPLLRHPRLRHPRLHPWLHPLLYAMLHAVHHCAMHAGRLRLRLRLSSHAADGVVSGREVGRGRVGCLGCPHLLCPLKHSLLHRLLLSHAQRLQASWYARGNPWRGLSGARRWQRADGEREADRDVGGGEGGGEGRRGWEARLQSHRRARRRNRRRRPGGRRLRTTGGHVDERPDGASLSPWGSSRRPVSEQREEGAETRGGAL